MEKSFWNSLKSRPSLKAGTGISACFSSNLTLISRFPSYEPISSWEVGPFLSHLPARQTARKLEHYDTSSIMGYFQILFICVLAASQSSAHFLLNYPPTIGMAVPSQEMIVNLTTPGFDDNLEGTAPCGSFTPDFSKDNVTNFGLVSPKAHPLQSSLY